jgi:hypothetical protein
VFILVSLVVMIVAFGVGLYASSNIVLPLLWSWPKAMRLRREGKLKTPIPTAGFLVAPLVWTLLVVGSWWIVLSMLPSLSTAYFFGLAAGVGQIARLVVKPNADMEADFATAYAHYLK